MAATDYWVSFRIGTEGNYTDRYNNLHQAINENGTEWWFETTSFYLVRSELSIDSFARRLVATIDKRHDILVIRELNRKRARYAGVITDDDIFIFMDYAKKL